MPSTGKVPTMSSSSTNLSASVLKRRAKVQALADKEAERSRKSRLESLLVQKLCVSATARLLLYFSPPPPPS